MFDNRWDNWAGDFAESFGASLIDPSVRNFVPDILSQFGTAVRKIDPDFPDDVRPGTFAAVMQNTMSRLKLPDASRPHVPEVIARFLEYLQETGRSGAGDQWADQIRRIRDEPRPKGKPASDVKGVTIRKPAVAAGRNDPCPCGSGKKYKKCCYGQ